MTHRTVLVGLLGEGVGPSLTPGMHEREGRRQGLTYVYRAIDLAPGESNPASVGALVTAAGRLGFTGLNVTHPIKRTIVPLLDELAPSALAVGAVNTIVFDGERRVGHNTDVTGFAAAWTHSTADLTLRRVVLVGAGGAGTAVAHALAASGIDALTIVDVDAERATALAEAVARPALTLRSASTATLGQVLADADALVNATPIGMAAHPGSPIALEFLRPELFVSDIVYRPVETALLTAARERGCTVMSGLGMAMNQAADAFEIFTGNPADRRAMLADLEDLVAAEAIGRTALAAPRRGNNR